MCQGYGTRPNPQGQYREGHAHSYPGGADVTPPTLLQPARLDGQVVLITGAGRGIGRATALALAGAGADVALLGRSASSLEAVAGEVQACGVRALVVSADVADWPAVAAAADRVITHFGEVHALVNNAGVIGGFGYVWELDPARFQETLLVNVQGPFNLTRALLPHMVQRGRGVVVNVSSGAGRHAAVARSAYSTSKAALDQLTAVLAAEARPHGVRVHTVHPGLVDTDMQTELRVGPGLPEAVRAEFEARQREGLLQPPEAPGSAIAWLVSPAGAQWPDLLFNWGDAAVRSRLLSG